MLENANQTMQIVQKESWVTTMNGVLSLLWKFLLVFFVFSLFFSGSEEDLNTNLESEEKISLSVLDEEGILTNTEINQTLPQVALISIEGIIAENDLGGMFGAIEQKRSDTIQKLRYVQKHPEIKGVILKVNSPGGTVYDSDLIASKMDELRTQGIKVVALLEEQAASGGYYIASQSDRIVAHYLTITGSIGSIIELPNVKALMEKVGVTVNAIASGKMKTMGSVYAELSPEEQEIFQVMINESYERFLDFVEKGRGLEREKLKEIADGRIYTGKQALEIGLVDQLGGFKEAKNEMTALLEVEKIQVIELNREYSPYELFFQSFGGVQSFLNKKTDLEMIKSLNWQSRILYL